MKFCIRFLFVDGVEQAAKQPPWHTEVQVLGLAGQLLTTKRDSGMPIAPLKICVLAKFSPAWLPICVTHSWRSATASSLTPYLISIDHLALMEQFGETIHLILGLITLWVGHRISLRGRKVDSDVEQMPCLFACKSTIAITVNLTLLIRA